MQLSKSEEFFFKALLEYTNNNLEVGNLLINFCNLIKKSNQLHNLTSITKINEMLIKHVLDSLSIKHLLRGKDVLDVGSGAGLPGIPLAIVDPETRFLLLDSNNKKIIFLNHVKINLNIKNIDLVHERIEDFNNEDGFDTVICRSYGSLSTIYSNSKRHLRDKGIIIAMKGKDPFKEVEDLQAIDKNIHIEIQNLNVPGLSAERHAVIINKK